MGHYGYAFNDQVDAAVIPLIGEIPKRWGRMNPMSRALIVEVGRLLLDIKSLAAGRNVLPSEKPLALSERLPGAV
jgi:hypothetical protein